MNSKLRSCDDCGGKVSKRAATCPHCGAPQDPVVESEEEISAEEQDLIDERRHNEIERLSKASKKTSKKTAKIRSEETSVKVGYAAVLVVWGCCALGLGFVVYVFFIAVDVGSDALQDTIKQSAKELQRSRFESERARIKREAAEIGLDRDLRDLQRKLDAL